MMIYDNIHVSPSKAQQRKNYIGSETTFSLTLRQRTMRAANQQKNIRKINFFCLLLNKSWANETQNAFKTQLESLGLQCRGIVLRL